MSLYGRTASADIQSAAPGLVASVSGNRIKFTVKKTEDKTPNTAKIEIYNLNEDTRNLIRLDDDKNTDQLITLNAGYIDDSGEEVLFVGTMTSVYHKFMRPNVISVIEASDGQGAMSKTKIDLSFGSDFSAKGILSTILNKIPLPNNLDTFQFKDKVYKGGITAVGLAKDGLNKVSEFLGLSWTIQNNEIRLIPFDGTDDTILVSISPTSGMIGSPERLTNESRKSKRASKKVKPGWKIISLLKPNVIPNGNIAVTSREIPENTRFKITNVTHIGDTHGPEWESQIEVVDR